MVFELELTTHSATVCVLVDRLCYLYLRWDRMTETFERTESVCVFTSIRRQLGHEEFQGVT